MRPHRLTLLVVIVALLGCGDDARMPATASDTGQTTSSVGGSESSSEGSESKGSSIAEGPPLVDVAQWQTGDRPTDIDGDPRPAIDGTPDYAGTDVP